MLNIPFLLGLVIYMESFLVQIKMIVILGMILIEFQVMILIMEVVKEVMILENRINMLK